MERDGNTWRGSSLIDIFRSKGPWSCALGSVAPSRFHTVLYQLPVDLQTPPRPHHSSQKRLWDKEHVQMPFSDKNLFPVKENGIDTIKKRWDIIKSTLSRPIESVVEFEMALGQYNLSLPKFEALEYFFNEFLNERDAREFFANLLPKIVKLALRLPELVPCGILLLEQNHNRSLSLSQLQISCLLANAFLCTFPWKKEVASTYPGINFFTLYSAFQRPARRRSICEKLRCLLHYFQRITQQEPRGVVTFERKMVPRANLPKWDEMTSELGATRIHVDSAGTIEDAHGCLQVDFANKNIGGGVLRYGCVQEEIRFVICPELIVSRLFVEQLNEKEAVIVTGVERFSCYSGYGDTFQFAGAFEDTTPHDLFGRRRTSICVIDAVKFGKTKEQFLSSMIYRELNKAFVGFSSRERKNLAPVATGNWGCGAFNGNKQLKSALQLAACAAAGRDLVYYSFGDEELARDLLEFHTFLSECRMTIGQLVRILRGSPDTVKDPFAYVKQTYAHITQTTSISKNSPKTPPISVNKYLNKESPKKKSHREAVSASPPSPSSSRSSPSSEDIIPATPPKMRRFVPLATSKPKTSENIVERLPQTNIGALIDALDGNANVSEPPAPNSIDEPMEVDEEAVTTNVQPQQKKITDYFLNKP